MTVAPAQAQQALLTTATRLGDAFTYPLEVAVHPAGGSAAWVLEDLITSLRVSRQDEAGRTVVATVPETASSPTFPTYPLFLGGNVEGFDLDQAGNLYIAGEIVDDSAAPRYIYRLTGNPASPVAVVAESFPSGGEPSGNGGPSQGAVFERPRAFRYHRGANALYFYDSMNDQIRRIDAPFDGTGIISAALTGVGGVVSDLGWDSLGRLHLLRGNTVFRLDGASLTTVLDGNSGGYQLESFVFDPGDNLVFTDYRSGAEPYVIIRARRPDGSIQTITNGSAFSLTSPQLTSTSRFRATGQLRLDSLGAVYLLDNPSATAWRLDNGADLPPMAEPPPGGMPGGPIDPWQGTSPDPVTTASGAFTYQRTDLAIPGRGPSPVVARSYRSLETRAGALGPGWLHSYEVRLRSPGDGTSDLLLVGPTGATDRYVVSAGSYTPAAGVTTTLVKEANGTFTATHPDQSRWTFDALGRLTALIDRHGNQSTLSYDAASGRLTTISDPAGRGVLTLTYHASGRLWKVTDWLTPTPRVVAYQYDASGRLQTVTDREGQVTTYAYDGPSHRLTTITDANGHVAVANHYDAQGRVDWQKDARGLTTGQQTTFAYVTNGDGSTTTTVTLPVTSFEPAWSPQLIDTHDPSGRLVTRVSKPTSTSGEWITETFAYDAQHNRTGVTDGRGHTTTFCYDVDVTGAPIAGNRRLLTRRLEPAPAPGQARPVTLFSYDSKDNLIQVIPPKGVASSASTDCTTNLSGALTLTYATDLAYDAPQITLLSVTRHVTDPDLGALDATTTYEYGDAANPGQVTRVIPPRGNTGGSPDYAYATTFAYGTTGSQAGLLTSTTVPAGSSTSTPAGMTTFSYDAVGRRISLVDPLGHAAGGVPAEHTWTYEYDQEDRLRVARAPAPTAGGSPLVTESRYDAVGNRTVVIDALGQVTKYAYDERDSLALVCQKTTVWTDPAPVTACPVGTIATSYSYDHLGTLSRVTRASGDAPNERATDYASDGLNRLRSETQYPSWPSTATPLVTQLAYDRASNRTTLVDPLGQTTTFVYDDRNRLTGLDYSSAATPDVTYNYDAQNNRTSMSDGTGTTSYTYDELDRLLAVTSPDPGGAKTVGYRYDRDGNRRKLVYPDSTAVTYASDEAGRLAGLTDWASRTTSYQYHPDSLLKLTTNLNGTTATQSYDRARRLTDVWHQQGTTTLARFTYSGLDALGNRTQLDETTPVSNPWGWGKNGNGQVGDGTTTDRWLPVPVSSLTAVAAVEGGGNHTLAALPDGTVRAWGWNNTGQLGNASLVNSPTPVTVLGPGGVGTLGGVSAVSGGGNHSLAVKGDGTVWAWGGNGQGQLGNGNQNQQTSPVQVQGGPITGVVAVAGGRDHSLALKADGTVWAWGRNDQGQLGDNTTVRKLTPVQVKGPGGSGVLTGVVAIAAGHDFSLALKQDGTIWAWGLNTNGQLGDNTLVRKLAPSQVKDAAGTGTLTGIAAISAGGMHSLALTTGGSVWAWGDNAEGQLGDNSQTDRKLPVQVKGAGGVGTLTGVTALAGGELHSLAIRSDGTVWGWGGNLYGQLGDNRGGTGTNVRQLTPVQVKDQPGTGSFTKATAVAAGWTHSLALSLVTSATTTQTTSYGYDRLSRLTSATTPTGGTSYTYDPVGNRLTRARSGMTATSSYDRADRLTSVVTGSRTVSYTVNAAGNLTVRGADTLGYDQTHRLTSATVSGGASSTYAYNGDGLRVSATVGGATTRSVYDVNTSLPVLLTDGSRKYVWGLGLAYTTDLGGSVQGVYHTDGLGSVRVLTDAAGSVVQTLRTDEFGVPQAGQGSGEQPFGYTGEQKDGETGLVYLRARLYDPQLGRFVQRDQFFGKRHQPNSLNRFAFAENNPIRFIDPSGYAALDQAKALCVQNN